MIFTTADGKSYDTQTDLNAGERHVLQKLILWESMVSTVDEFRNITLEALRKGWNNSGPIRAGAALSHILKDLETRVVRRTQS
ncbi:MAG: hypothetical protein ACQET7_04485 [Thermodesulfobacteriota bacterium]